MGRKDTLAELRTFQRDFKEYRDLIHAVYSRSPGGWGVSPTDAEDKRVDALREDLSRQYGRLRPAIAEPQGGVPVLGSNMSGVAGEVFQVALRDPWDNPWLSGALDGSSQTISIAIGHFERAQAEDIVTLTSLAYWWRRIRGALLALYREVKDLLTLLTKLRPGP